MINPLTLIENEFTGNIRVGMPESVDRTEPELINIDTTEWWMLFEQIKAEKCQVTGSEYDDVLWTPNNDRTIVNVKREWHGTVITPGGDQYFVKAHDVQRATFEPGDFISVEKLS